MNKFNPQKKLACKRYWKMVYTTRSKHSDTETLQEPETVAPEVLEQQSVSNAPENSLNAESSNAPSANASSEETSGSPTEVLFAIHPCNTSVDEQAEVIKVLYELFQKTSYSRLCGQVLTAKKPRNQEEVNQILKSGLGCDTFESACNRVIEESLNGNLNSALESVGYNISDYSTAFDALKAYHQSVQNAKKQKRASKQKKTAKSKKRTNKGKGKAVVSPKRTKAASNSKTQEVSPKLNDRSETKPDHIFSKPPGYTGFEAGVDLSKLSSTSTVKLNTTLPTFNNVSDFIQHIQNDTATLFEAGPSSIKVSQYKAKLIARVLQYTHRAPHHKTTSPVCSLYVGSINHNDDGVIKVSVWNLALTDLCEGSLIEITYPNISEFSETSRRFLRSSAKSSAYASNLELHVREAGTLKVLRQVGWQESVYPVSIYEELPSLPNSYHHFGTINVQGTLTRCTSDLEFQHTTFEAKNCFKFHFISSADESYLVYPVVNLLEACDTIASTLNKATSTGSICTIFGVTFKQDPITLKTILAVEVNPLARVLHHIVLNKNLKRRIVRGETHAKDIEDDGEESEKNATYDSDSSFQDDSSSDFESDSDSDSESEVEAGSSKPRKLGAKDLQELFNSLSESQLKFLLEQKQNIGSSSTST